MTRPSTEGGVREEEGKMSMFYIPEQSKKRCEESRNHKAPDTFSGVDAIDGLVKVYTGVVQSIEDHGESSPQGRRWRVTVLDN
jgi:hypothetical protein